MEKITLKNLKLHNFGIFKDEEIDFTGKDIIGILAEYENDITRSNRSGKTLCVEAIKYLLIGTTRAKRNISMIHHGQSEMLVTGTFIDSNGKEYTIRRGVDSKSNSVLELDWIEKSKESQEAIGNLFGVSREDFELTSFFKQADINGFMDLSPSDKSKYLMQAMDITHWQKKYDLVLEDIKKATNELRDNEAVKKALENSLEDIDDLKMVKNELSDKTGQLDAERKKLISKQKIIDNEIAEARSEYKNSIKELKLLKSQREEFKEKIDRIATYKDRIKKLKNKISKVVLEDLPDKNKAIDDKYKLQTKISEVESKLNSLKSNSGGICPILKISCKDIKVTKSDLIKLNDEISKLKILLKRKLNILSQHAEQELSTKEIEKDRVTIVRLTDRIKILSNVAGQTDYDKDIEELTSQISLFSDDKLTKNREIIEGKIDEIDEELTILKQKLGGIKQRLVQAKDALVRIDTVSLDNKRLKTELSDLKYICSMFSKNGIVANEIENAFSVIEDDCNMLLKELDYGPTIVFSPDKELTKWEAICQCGFKFPKGYRASTCDECGSPRMKQRKDEVALRILENGIEKDFAMDSGGGRIIISFVVRLALTMYKRRNNKCKLNMLFLDEVDSALDKHLSTTITNAITKVLTKKLGFEQIFMISHKDEIKYSVPHILKVTRHSDYSTARFV